MSTTTKWAHLPNAVHIDRVLASYNSHPTQWVAACDVAQNISREATRLVVQNLVSKQILDVEWNALWLAAHTTRLYVLQGKHNVMWDIISCLLAYDDCAHLLDAEVKAVEALASIGSPKAIMLLPACIALNAIKNNT